MESLESNEANCGVKRRQSGASCLAKAIELSRYRYRLRGIVIGGKSAHVPVRLARFDRGEAIQRSISMISIWSDDETKGKKYSTCLPAGDRTGAGIQQRMIRKWPY